MKIIANYKTITLVILASMVLMLAYEVISRPPTPTSFRPDYHEKEDSKFAPEIQALIELPLRKLEELAYKSDAKSQYIVGMRYQFGVEAFPDYDKARVWYRRSANGGEPAAMYWLKNIDHNLSADQKSRLLEKSAELGYWRARSELKLRDFSRDFPDVSKNKAASQTKIPIWNYQDFHVLYMHGKDLYIKKLRGIDIDDQLMYNLFKTASIGGDNKAQEWLGRYYAEADPEQSERWYTHSAYNKNTEAYESIKYITAKKFFAKEEIENGGVIDASNPLKYYDFERLVDSKKSYGRVAYFWKEMANLDASFSYDLWFYERWQIKRIAEDCKKNYYRFSEDCIDKYRHGVLFKNTFISDFFRYY